MLREMTDRQTDWLTTYYATYSSYYYYCWWIFWTGILQTSIEKNPERIVLFMYLFSNYPSIHPTHCRCLCLHNGPSTIFVTSPPQQQNQLLMECSITLSPYHRNEHTCHQSCTPDSCGTSSTEPWLHTICTSPYSHPSHSPIYDIRMSLNNTNNKRNPCSSR